jgi:hypothetical protein
MEETAKDIVAHYSSTMDILKAFGPPLVASIAALIAFMAAIMASVIQYNQWRTAREKLRSDLFDRRMAIYNQVYLALLEMRNRGNVSQEELRALRLAINSAKFLFPPNLSNALEIFYEKFGDYRGWFGRWRSESNKDLPDGELIAELTGKMRVADDEMDKMVRDLPQTFRSVLFFGNI